MGERFISKLNMYAKAIRILSKGYLTLSLLPPSELQEILGEGKKAIHTTNQNYAIVIKRLHLYYNRNLIIQFPVFVQPYTQQPLIPYQTETVSVPIVEQIKRQILTLTCREIDAPLL